MGRKRKWIGIIVCLALTVGCAGLSNKKSTSPTVSAKEKRSIIQRLANDIPLYPKFEYQPDKSFFYESNGVKAGVMVFEGKAKVGELVKFYKNEMPAYGWNLESAYEYGKNALLDFETPEKNCQISIHEETFKTILIIRTGTKPIQWEKPETTG